jgi:hypothetical protein
MSAPLSSPQKFAGTCTTPAFDADPASPLFELHAAITTTAAATAAHLAQSAIVVFAFIAYLLTLFHIIVDLFWRDHQTTGWVKAFVGGVSLRLPVPDDVELSDRTRPGRGGLDTGTQTVDVARCNFLSAFS